MKLVGNKAELQVAAGKILGLVINGETTESVLVCAKTEIAQELYVGITFDPQASLPVLIFSLCGGMDIEEAARTSPDKVVRMHLVPTQPLRGYQVLHFLHRAGLASELLPKVADAVEKLIAAFNGSDAMTAEINPLVLTPREELLAIDSKVVIDDSALPRQQWSPSLKATRRWRYGRERSA